MAIIIPSLPPRLEHRGEMVLSLLDSVQSSFLHHYVFLHHSIGLELSHT